MSESENSPSKARQIRRNGQRFLISFQFVLFLIAICAANYLSCAHHRTVDLTVQKDFTLSPLSTSYLAGENMQNLEQPLRIIAAIRPNSPHYQRMRGRLEAYQRAANGQISIEFLDPFKNLDRAQEITNTYRHTFTEDILILDARKSEDQSRTEDSTSRQQMSAHVRFVPISALYLMAPGADNKLIITEWQDERVITSQIIGAVEGNPRKFYFIADKSKLEGVNKQAAAWENYAAMLYQMNIQLVPIRISELAKLPEDAAGVALIAPAYDFTDTEIEILREYWDRTPSAVFIALDPNNRLANLNSFLRRYGVSARNDRVVSTSRDGETLRNVRALFTREPDVNKQIGGKPATFEGPSSSLEVRENDEDLLNRLITPVPLIEANERWWGETRYQDAGTPEFNAEEDNAAPIYLGAKITRGNASDDQTRHLTGRMVVVSNSGFMEPNSMRAEQEDFLNASSNWLIGREELIGIGPRKVVRHKLTLPDKERSLVNKICLIGMPLAALLAALVVWNTRRA
ncbi:Gldg family protein [Persicirhabdus sediminis]|uniref:Gldg family protein n=1 Tax=Persicirhabdus sediminis TaxID=454144 RepID=A0A8J7MEK4_9BACT|nr:Gldg family protein [Persicirhabdus sediminis]MBK1791083.1 Gldg family protein [Persicirhabdus sediminis]